MKASNWDCIFSKLWYRSMSSFLSNSTVNLDSSSPVKFNCNNDIGRTSFLIEEDAA